MAAHEVVAPARLVDVVAEKRDEVRLVGDNVAIGAEKSLLVLLAGREREAQALRRRRRRGRSARATDRALGGAGGEAVPVPALGLESRHFDVHGMGPRRLRNCFSRRNNRFHRLARGEFPAHADREGIETAGEARPEDDAVRRRITRCHAERERVRIETDLAIGGAGWKRLRNTKRRENLQEPAAADHGESISGPCFRVLTRLASYMRYVCLQIRTVTAVLTVHPLAAGRRYSCAAPGPDSSSSRPRRNGGAPRIGA